jgi:hypothetical protein
MQIALNDALNEGLHTMPGKLQRKHAISADVAGRVSEALTLALADFDDRLQPLMLPGA